MRYASLDVFRGIACFAVILIHASLIMTGEYWDQALTLTDQIITRILGFGIIGGGTRYFFVISGFVLAAACTSALKKGNVWGYPIRRYKRIYPLFWIALGIAIILNFLLWRSGRMDLLDTPMHNIVSVDQVPILGYITNFFLLESWMPSAAPHIGGPFYILGVSWSLCYDLQFCVLIALYFGFFKRKAFHAMTIFAVALAGYLWLSHFSHAKIIGGTLLDGRFVIYYVGVAAYFRVNMAKDLRSKYLVELFLIILAIAFYHEKGRVASEIWMASIFSIFLIHIYPSDAKFSQWKFWAPFKYIGSRSFSIYLIHAPIVVLIANVLASIGVRGPLLTLTVVVPVCVGAALLLSEVFYRYVEYPLIRS